MNETLPNCNHDETVTRQREPSPPVLGNVYNKYSTRNPVARLLFHNFIRVLRRTVTALDVETVLEVGCGEGFLSQKISEWLPEARNVAVDLSGDVFDSTLVASGEISFCLQSAYQLGFPPQHFDFVVGVEILEHLRRPETALREILRVANRHVLLSVPREPVWRLMNLARLSYLRNWGNTPGHIQHWSSAEFIDFVARHCRVLRVAKPLPWTVVLAAKNDYPS